MEVFAKMINKRNLVVIAYLFEITHCNILEYLLGAQFQDVELFSFISTYFGIVETNSQGTLDLY